MNKVFNICKILTCIYIYIYIFLMVERRKPKKTKKTIISRTLEKTKKNTYLFFLFLSFLISFFYFDLFLVMLM